MLVEEHPPVSEPGATRHLRTHAIRGGGVLLACKWMAQILSWGVTLGVARILSPEDYGVMAAAGILLGLSDLFAEAGVGRALVQKKSISALDYAHAFTLSLILALMSYCVLLAVTPWASRFLRTPELARVLPVMGTLILVVPFRTVPLGILDRRLAMKSQGLLHIIATSLQAATVLSLAILGAGYWALVSGAILARGFEAVSLAYMTGWKPQISLSIRGARELLSYGAWVSGGSLLWYFYSNSDFAVVGRMEGPVVLGYYSLAFQLMSLPVQKVTANINQIAFPVFCRLQGQPAIVKSWYLRLTVLMIAAILPTLLGSALVARDGIAFLFGAKWLPAVLPFQLLCVVGVLSVITASLISLLNAIGRPDINFKYNAISALVFPIAFSVAGSYHGVIGVCWAWVVIYTIAMSLLLIRTRSITTIRLTELVSAQAPSLVAAAVMAMAVLGFQQVVGASASNGARLLGAVSIGVISFGGCLWIAGRDTVVADILALLKDLKTRPEGAAN